MLKRTLVASILMAGFSVPASAQYTYDSWLRVQVKCVEGPDTYQEICPLVRQVIRGDIDFRLEEYLDRYIVEIHAIEMGKNLRISVSISVIYPDYDPFSEHFPYHVYSVPIVARTSEASSVAEEIVDVYLHKSVRILGEYFDNR